MTTVLVIEDEAALRENLRELLVEEGFEVVVAPNGRVGLARALATPPDIVLCDVLMPGLDGWEVLRRLRETPAFADVPFVFLTALSQHEDVRHGMQLGADDYLKKPFEPDEVLGAIRGSLARRRPDPGVAASVSEPPVVLSPAHEAVWARATQVADTSLSVLLLGETGVGKDVLANAIHARSGRKGPFVPLHCASMPAGLLEAELFGHEREAFTGAVEGREGLFEVADGGTVFLDEIGEISLESQVTLLRVLEDRVVRRIRGLTSRVIDVRFVAATNRDLVAAVAAGTFREDLYYRLGMRLELPPLRDRVEEIEPLARRFARAAAARWGRPAVEPDPAVIARLQGWEWPGNVRELRDVIEQAVARCRGATLTEDLLPERMCDGAPPPIGESFQDRVDALKRRLIVDALEQSGGNQTRAAAALGLPLRTLVTQIERFDLRRPRKR